MEKFMSGGFVEGMPKEGENLVVHMKYELIPIGVSCYMTSVERLLHRKKKIPSMGVQLAIDALEKINGVVFVNVEHHQFEIGKTPAFKWKELIPKIKLALATYLPPTYGDDWRS